MGLVNVVRNIAILIINVSRVVSSFMRRVESPGESSGRLVKVGGCSLVVSGGWSRCRRKRKRWWRGGNNITYNARHGDE